MLLIIVLVLILTISLTVLGFRDRHFALLGGVSYCLWLPLAVLCFGTGLAQIIFSRDFIQAGSAGLWLMALGAVASSMMFIIIHLTLALWRAKDEDAPFRIGPPSQKLAAIS